MNTFSNWEEGIIDNIQSGIWYDRTQAATITDPANEILVPIWCLFIDGTVLSLSGSLALEPVMFSLMIHNRERPVKNLKLG